MFVIGTAGHVDHGKSTLVKALTGIDPDRLAEEKAREMTIDLGFAWLNLAAYQPDLAEVGVVDVPGHRDFIENMLAGVGGIDLALFVIAADEGVMPQTREHLAILDLLKIGGGVVALTKIDMTPDPEWLELVMLDVQEALAGTVLGGAPLVPVSARTGQGLGELKAALAAGLGQIRLRPDNGRPRLAVDRVFTLAGFGTIVTGTLMDGHLQVGDQVVLYPAGLKARIRGLQSHKTKLEVARPGSRVAVNLTGVNKEEVRRGDVLARPGVIHGSQLCDVAYQHLADNDGPLTHNAEVKLFVGAAEVIARVRVLGSQQIKPGETGWLQLVLREAVAMVRGDRFILRRPSPGTTIGGGQIVDAHPGRQHRRFRPELIAHLQTLSQGTPAELLLQTLSRLEPIAPAGLFKQANLEPSTAEAAWQELLAQQQIVLLDQQALSYASWQNWLGRLQKMVGDYHQSYPLRPGIPREELRSRLRLSATIFNPFLAQAVKDKLVEDNGAVVFAPGWAIRLSPTQQATASQLLTRMGQAGINSPSLKDCKAFLGDDLYVALVELGQLRPLNEDVIYARPEYEQVTSQLLNFLGRSGRINAAQVRDLFNTSRKYAIALLEHLDSLNLTRRIGDERELVGRSLPIASDK